MNLPKPTSMKYDELIGKIKSGKIKIPQFQREFVWDLQKSAKLLDSIIKGYPIGTFIIWKTNERLKMIGELGRIVLKQPEPNEMVEYVLDGQQRVTSLFVALLGEKVGKVDYSNIYLNLEAEQDEDIIITDVSDLSVSSYIQFGKLLNSNLSDILRIYRDDEEKINLIDRYRRNVSDYDFSVIEVANAPIEVATDIFTRINVGGKPLTVFEIMCAKVFDRDSGFDLFERFDLFIHDLEDINFDTIPPSIPLQLIALVKKQACKGSTILSLTKEDVIESWDKAVSSLKSSIDFVRSSFGVQNSKLLPYDVLLIPIAYYVYKTGNISPVGDAAKYLADMFWRYAYMQRYNNATESKLTSDVSIINEVINGGDYKPAVSVDLSEKYLRDNGSFRIAKGITKAIICLLLLQQPKRLDTENQKVLTDDKGLIKGNGKNYHHFFPRAYMRKFGYDDEFVDNIANIVVVDDYTNKYRIKDKAPSVYISEFAKKNQQIGIALASHLIGDIEEFGIKTDSYQTFFSKRAEWINQELAKFLCLDSEVSVDEDNEEIADISAHEAYKLLWEKLDEALKKQMSPISINAISASRIQTSNIIPSKVYLRFIASAQNQSLTCELVFKDESIYNQLLTQKSEFESLCDLKGLVWSDQSSKTKRISLDYKKNINVFDKSKYDSFISWFMESGITLKEVIELFAEDMNIGKGYAPDLINEPEMVFCVARAVKSAGYYYGKRIGFVVLKGSKVKITTKAYGSSQKKREELIKLGIIKVMSDGKGEFLNDCTFSTPSQAADAILGGSNNGWVKWKNASGEKTLDDMYRNYKI